MSAIRLTFEIIEGKPQFKSARRVLMRTPPQQFIPDIERCAGIWIEVRDKKGYPVYRRVIDAETFTSTAEISTGTSDRPIVRHTSKRMVSLFHAVIPGTAESHSFHILEQRSSDPKKKPVELISLDINKSCPPDSDKEIGK